MKKIKPLPCKLLKKLRKKSRRKIYIDSIEKSPLYRVSYVLRIENTHIFGIGSEDNMRRHLHSERRYYVLSQLRKLKLEKDENSI